LSSRRERQGYKQKTDRNCLPKNSPVCFHKFDFGDHRSYLNLFRHFQLHLRRHLRHVFVAATGEVQRFNNSATSTAVSGKACGAAWSPVCSTVFDA
jgi:hypothetical protein